jgi:hypothetical protein
MHQNPEPMRILKSLFCALLLCAATIPAVSQITLSDVPPGRVAIAAFKLDQAGKVKISGTAGIFMKDWQAIAYYGWILNAETREVVWRMGDRLLKEDFDLGEIDVSDEVSLPGGTYEFYFTAASAQRNNEEAWTSNVRNNIQYIFGSSNKWDRGIQEQMTLTVSGQNVTAVNFRDVFRAKTADAIISIQRPDHNSNTKLGFSLSAETTIKIYAIGEAHKDEIFDFAWIYDLDKGKRVWEMTYQTAEFAGGADKNILVDAKIKLPAGNYLVTYVTDDSHGYNSWNMMPPDDPQFSGITLWADAADKKNVIPFKAPEQLKPVVGITKVGDDDFITKGISVKSAVDVRVLCLGEESSSEMADGGWIINAATREVVWDFNRQHTKHAGGAKKNRLFDGTIRLEKGDYIVYYASDDSHSYGRWNSGPPYEQDYWGITVWTTKKEDLVKIASFNPSQYKTESTVAEILRVRDDEDRFESFTLTRDTRLRIIALGEGSDGDMDDFGWIENTATGRTVWDMTYRSTTHGGGAGKNRLFNDIIILPKGQYKVYYRTDGSHSYRDWNASPPHDQEKYGISIYKEAGE